jgi:hypothetical protein
MNAAWQPILRIAAFQGTGPVYPFTFGAITLSFLLAYRFTRSLLTSLTLPFAFVGLYEILWHLIPNSGASLNTPGLIYCLSWLAVGCFSVRQWRLDLSSILMIVTEVVLFGVWYSVGFLSPLSVPLNIITKVLMALVFIRLLQVGSRKIAKTVMAKREVEPIL